VGELVVAFIPDDDDSGDVVALEIDDDGKTPPPARDSFSIALGGCSTNVTSSAGRLKKACPCVWFLSPESLVACPRFLLFTDLGGVVSSVFLELFR
jgi:hypothetical protein